MNLVPKAAHSARNRLSSIILNKQKEILINSSPKLIRKTKSIQIPSSKVFIVGKDLFAQLVNKLIKTQVDFSLDFVVKKLFTENGQSVMGRIVIKIQRK